MLSVKMLLEKIRPTILLSLYVSQVLQRFATCSFKDNRLNIHTIITLNTHFENMPIQIY